MDKHATTTAGAAAAAVANGEAAHAAGGVNDPACQFGRPKSSKFDSAAARAAAAAGAGSVGSALAYDEAGLEERERLLLGWEACRSGEIPIDAMLGRLKPLKTSGYGLAELLTWQMAKVEAAVTTSTEEGSDRLRALLEDMEGRDSRDPLADAERIHRTMVALDRGASPNVALRNLLLETRI